MDYKKKYLKYKLKYLNFKKIYGGADAMELQQINNNIIKLRISSLVTQGYTLDQLWFMANEKLLRNPEHRLALLWTRTKEIIEDTKAKIKDNALRIIEDRRRDNVSLDEMYNEYLRIFQSNITHGNRYALCILLQTIIDIAAEEQTAAEEQAAAEKQTKDDFESFFNDS